MSARRLRGTSALAALKSAMGNSTPHSQRERATISEGGRLLWPGPKSRPVRPGEGGEKGQGSARRYASFEDVRTKFIAAIKRSTPASCRAQSEGKHAGRRKSYLHGRRRVSGSRRQ